MRISFFWLFIKCTLPMTNSQQNPWRYSSPAVQPDLFRLAGPSHPSCDPRFSTCVFMEMPGFCGC